MHFSTVFSVLLIFALRAFSSCLTKADADQLVTDFISLTNGGTFSDKLAREIIAPNVVDTSGSVASVINGGM